MRLSKYPVNRFSMYHKDTKKIGLFLYTEKWSEMKLLTYDFVSWAAE